MKSMLIVFMLLQAFVVNGETSKEGTFKVDSEHSNVGFSVPHLMISSVEGTFTMIEGTIELKENFQDSKVRVMIDTSSIHTGVERRDEHLKSSDFLHSQKFPQMTFVSTEIIGSKERFNLVGKLTIKGVTRIVSFDTHFIGIVAVGYGDDKAVFVGKTKINRNDFGISWNKNFESGKIIGDEISIDLRILATRPSGVTAKLFDGVREEYK
jgi:polyisoprenoid-binding protein YceI